MKRLAVTPFTGLAGCLILFACGGEKFVEPPPPTVASVTVTPASPTLLSLRATVQLGASAHDASGNILTDKTFTWTSSDTAVATVSSSGLARSVDNGVATIRATTDGVSGSESVTVVIPVHQTLGTDADGMVQFADSDLEVGVVNVVTEEPISGIQVTLIGDGAVMGLVMFDPDGEFVPVIRMMEQASRSAARSPSAGTRASTIPISVWVRMIPRSFQDEVAYFPATFSKTLMRYVRNRWFECRETTLDNAFTLVDALQEGAYVAAAEFTVLAVNAALAGTIIGAPVAGALEALGLVSTVGSLGVVAFNLQIVDFYRALGYSDSDGFEVCQLNNNLIGQFLDALILLAPVEELPPPIGTVSVAGTVRNATTSVAIPAEVELAGPSPRGLSTTDGSFEFTNLISGSYELSAASLGFLPSSVSLSVAGSEAIAQDIALSPRLTSGTLRIVLSWGVNPLDLDSHLWTPQIEESAYHVYFADRGSLTSAPFAGLDVDDVSSFGPETITNARSFAGTYTYAVHDYSNRGSTSSDALFQSGASVDVFSADELLASFRVGNVTNPGIGTWWHLFTLDGGTQILTVINQLSSSAPVSSGALSAPKVGRR